MLWRCYKNTRTQNKEHAEITEYTEKQKKKFSRRIGRKCRSDTYIPVLTK